jgi:DNA-binding CsgD family transcriptional regulator
VDAGFDDSNAWSQADRRSRLTVMDRDLVYPDRLLRRMFDVLDEARRDNTDDVPPRAVIRGLARLVPGLECSFVELDWPTRRELIGQGTYEDEYGVGFDPGTACGIDDPTFWRLVRQMPTCRYLRATGRMDVVQISDFITTRQLHKLEIYQQWLRLEGTEHGITLPLPAPPGRTRSFGLSRGPGSGFTETERMMLTLLQPHLYQTYQSAARRRRLTVQLTARQLDVLRCVALGMSNDQIARRLVIAPGTVTKHLENVYARLGVTSRTAAVARVFNDPDTEPTSVAPRPSPVDYKPLSGENHAPPSHQPSLSLDGPDARKLSPHKGGQTRIG